MKILLLDIDCREIPDTTNYYVSDKGRIFSTKYNKLRELSQWVNSNGYLTTKINNKLMPVHRAVALAWIGESNGLDVNHKDGNKFNNDVGNLEFISRRDNLKHALKNGLHALKETPIKGINNATGEEVSFSCQCDANKAGFLQTLINRCLKGRSHTHRGFTWSYL